MIVRISAYQGRSPVEKREVFVCRAEFVRLKKKKPSRQFQPTAQWIVETISSDHGSPIRWRVPK